jgi:hypothetical protein
MLAIVACLLAAQNAEEMPDPVAVADQAIQPSLALDPDGGVYVAMIRKGNIEVAVSTDAGKTFAAPVAALDAKGKAQGGQQRGPRIAVDSKKRIYVTAPVFLEIGDRPGGTPPPDLWLAVSTDRGKSFGKPVRLNELPGTVPEALHAAAVAPGGDLHVAWLDAKRGKGQDLVHAKVTEQGRKIVRTLVASAVCERCAPAVAVDAKGAPVLAFREGPGKKTRQTLFAGPAGGAFDRPVRANHFDTAVTACPMDAPAIAVSPDGKTVALAWMDLRAGGDDRNVYWTYRKDGKFREEEPCHAERRFFQGHPSLAIDGEGALWVAWEDGRHSPQRVYARTSQYAVDISVTRERDPRGGFPSIAAAGAFVACAFESGDGVGLRVLAAPQPR